MNREMFKQVGKKVLISALAITMTLGMASPALAAEVKTNPADYAKVVAYENGISIETAISNIKGTISTLKINVMQGMVSERKLETLAQQLYDLEKAVKSSNQAPSASVISILNDAENVVQGVKGNEVVLTAVATVRGSLSRQDSDAKQAQAPNQVVTSFTDMREDHWAYKAVMECVNRGAINGTTNPVNGVGTYNPNGTVTLGEFLTVFARLVAKDQIPAFVPGTHWATPYYEAAITAGIITPSEYDHNDLGNPLSRQEMAHIMVNVATINGETLVSRPNTQNAVADYNKVDPLYQSDVLKCYSNGLITGTDSKGTFAPTATMTRAEMAMVIARLMNYVSRVDVLIPSQPGGTISVPDSGYGHYVVTNEGETKGMLRASYSTQYNIEALSMVRTGEDANGVYVVYTAPTLPAELQADFEFSFNISIFDKDNNYLSEDGRARLKSGENKKVYLNGMMEGQKVTASQIASARIGVSVQNTTNRHVYMIGSSINFYDKTNVTEKYYDGSYEFQTLDINVANEIWKGIGK